MLKLCECGCGKVVSMVAYNCKTRGWIKGEPLRFSHGHNTRTEFHKKTRNELLKHLGKRSYRKGPGIKLICEVCKKEFFKKPYEIKERPYRFCSIICRGKIRSGGKNRDPNWKEYRKACNKKWREAHPEYNRQAALKWRRNNIDKARNLQKVRNNKIRATPKGALNHAMYTTICKVLNGNKRNRNWESLVEYSVDQLKKHLERHFLPGMSWENRNEWHVDHIIPLSAFNYEKPEDIDFKRAWTLKNLQPLWKLENISKGKKLKQPFQPALIF